MEREGLKELTDALRTELSIAISDDDDHVTLFVVGDLIEGTVFETPIANGVVGTKVEHRNGRCVFPISFLRTEVESYFNSN